MEEEKVTFTLDDIKLVCPNCGGKIKLQLKELDNIIKSYDKIKDNINEIKLKIENMIKSYSNNQLNNIIKLINLINENIKNNNEKLINLFNIQKNIIKDNIIDNTNDINNNKSNEVKDILDLDNRKTNREENDILNNKNLLENIKSKIIIKKIFSNMDEKVKLKSIKYNKKLQKKNDISLTNYKLFSCRYIIYLLSNNL